MNQVPPELRYKINNKSKVYTKKYQREMLKELNKKKLNIMKVKVERNCRKQ